MALIVESQNPERDYRSHSRRARLLWCVLAVLITTGLVQFSRGPWVHEWYLHRLSASQLQDWTIRNGNDALAHHYLGVAYQRSGEMHKAAAEYVRALNLDPTLSRARVKLAGTLVISGQSRAAETILLEGVQIEPNYADLHKGLGQIYEERQDFRRAVTAWEKTTSLAPRDAAAWFHLGNCWIGLNDETRALPGYERAAALEPLSAEHQKAFASVLRLRGRLQEAEQHSRRAIQLRPDDPEAYFDLMKVLRDRDGATLPVEESIQKAVSLQPNDPQFRYYLATILQERGNQKQAVTEYNHALRLFGDNRPHGLTAQWNAYGLWLSYVEGCHFNLARLLKRRGLAQDAAKELDTYRRLSNYHQSANQLIGVAANRPRDAMLRFRLARLHTDAGFVELAAEQFNAGQQLEAIGGASQEGQNGKR